MSTNRHDTNVAQSESKPATALQSHEKPSSGKPLDTKIRMAYDFDLKRPGCVLMQAVMGGDSNAVSRLFDCKGWLLAPTPGMRLVLGTEEEWKQASEITDAEMQRLEKEKQCRKV